MAGEVEWGESGRGGGEEESWVRESQSVDRSLSPPRSLWVAYFVYSVGGIEEKS